MLAHADVSALCFDPVKLRPRVPRHVYWHLLIGPCTVFMSPTDWLDANTALET